MHLARPTSSPYDPGSMGWSPGVALFKKFPEGYEKKEPYLGTTDITASKSKPFLLCVAHVATRLN